MVDRPVSCFCSQSGRTGQKIPINNIRLRKQRPTTGDVQTNPSRYFSVKRQAAEVRRKAELRERQAEMEKREEEIKTQLMATLQGIIDKSSDGIHERIKEKLRIEKPTIKEDIREDLERIESDIKEEIEKMRSDDVMQGFVERIQRQFRNEFQSTINHELDKIQDEISASLDEIVESGRRKWEESIKRETGSKILTVKDAIQTDFTVGIEDSQKQCSEILTSVSERTKSLETKFLCKIEAATSSSQGNIQSAEKVLRSFVESRLSEKEKSLQYLLREETNQMNERIRNIEKMAAEQSHNSRVCTIL